MAFGGLLRVEAAPLAGPLRSPFPLAIAAPCLRLAASWGLIYEEPLQNPSAALGLNLPIRGVIRVLDHTVSTL